MSHTWNRRRWLASAGALMSSPLVASGGEARPAQASAALQTPPADTPLRLVDFEPRSMLHVAETRVDKPAVPVIDIHTHLTFRSRSTQPATPTEATSARVPAAALLPVMDDRGVETMVNLTGGAGAGLAQAIATFDRTHPGRFVTMTEPTWARASTPGFAQWQGDEIGKAKAAGAAGVKVLKTLGLYLREPANTGALVTVDDRRFDPMWEACGGAGVPVAIHVGDPEAFFLPTDRFNERYEELANHPNWSFHGRDFPSFASILEARDRVFARHPKTTFVALHMGHWAENLQAVGEMLDRFPNVHVEMGARIGELGRQPRTSRRFFDRYQDRILFGTDAVPEGTETPQQVFGLDLYGIYYRFLETEDEYFDYAPSRVPPQGRWRIYGLGLPEPILRKVYRENALRVLPPRR